MRYFMFISILLLAALSARADFTVLVIDTGISSERTELTKYVPKTYKADYEDHHYTGHGTHVASLILDKVCPEIKIIPCVFYRAGRNPLLESNKCLELGLKLNVDLVNMSMSGEAYSKTEHDILKKYEARGIPVHVSLGNDDIVLEGEDKGAYPAGLELTNIVRIGSLKDNKFGPHTNISSNAKYLTGNYWAADRKKGKKKFMKGTSQATAKYTNLFLRKQCLNTKK